MNDQWTDRLSEYVDGELEQSERRALEAHLATCPACAATLGELRRVVARAHALDDRPPAADLWPGVASGIGLAPHDRAAALDLGQARRVRRFTFSVPQLLAASVALMVVSAAAVWLTLGRGRVPGSGPIAQGDTSVPQVAAGNWARDPNYDTAIGQLESALAEGRRSGKLDSATVRILEANLAIVDAAIAEGQRALASDPGSAYLNYHLADTMRRKLELLRQATTIARAQT